MPQQNSEFGRYSDRIRDLTPRAQILPEGATPFPVKYVSRSEIMFFNFGSYGHVLLSEFFGAGGKVEIREFHNPSELGGLKEKVVINCPGYAARDLWKDKYMIPVRGQTGWLIPQPEVNYGLSYGGTQHAVEERRHHGDASAADPSRATWSASATATRSRAGRKPKRRCASSSSFMRASRPPA